MSPSKPKQTYKKEFMKKYGKHMLMAALVTVSAVSVLPGSAAYAAIPYVNTTVQGALAPGVYGRIEIGNAPPPPLIYTQPIIIQQAPVYAQQPPLYLHVPPGHAKKWSRHCAQYNACNRPVYFVRVPGDEGYERRHGREEHRVYETDHDDDHGNRRDRKHEKDHDKGHGKDHDKD